MELHLVDTIADATVAGQARTIKGPLPIRALFFAYEGTNDTEDDTDFDDITGYLRCAVTGDKGPTGDVRAVSRAQALVTWANAYYGRPYTASVTAGAYCHVLPTFFGMERDDNVLFLRQGQRMVVYPPAIDDTNLAGGEAQTCQIYVGVHRGGVCRYRLGIFDESVTLAAKRRYVLSEEGCGGVIISASDDTDPDDFALLMGPEQKRRIWGDWDSYNGVWQTAMRIEAAPTYTDNVIDATDLGRDLHRGFGIGAPVLELNGGAGDVTVTQTIVDFHTGGALQESLQARAVALGLAKDALVSKGADPAQLEALVPSPQLPSPGHSAPVPQLPVEPKTREKVPGVGGPSGGYVERVPQMPKPHKKVLKVPR